MLKFEFLGIASIGSVATLPKKNYSFYFWGISPNPFNIFKNKYIKS